MRSIADQMADLMTERDALKAFKRYVHDRLDVAGVTVDPESPHKAQGCRIGGRLDEVFAERDRLRAVNADLLAACEAARTYLLHSERGPIASADLYELKRKAANVDPDLRSLLAFVAGFAVAAAREKILTPLSRSGEPDRTTSENLTGADMRIDLSLKNSDLYVGCTVETVAGRDNLTTPIPDAVGLVGANIARIVAATPPEDRREVTLTGPMAVWAYLIVFHAVVHAFARVYYDDGRSGPVLIAAHGG